MKLVTVKIRYGNKELSLHVPAGKALKDVFKSANVPFVLYCGGRGRCGRCAVTFIEGSPRATALDEAFFTEKELEEGKRLLCRCILDKDATVKVEDVHLEDNMEVLTAKTSAATDEAEFVSYGVAVDIGTTTIVTALVGLDKYGISQILNTKGVVNHQRKYGLDVISRISAAEDENAKKEMLEIVRKDIVEAIRETGEAIDVSAISKICITGNTTMLHLLLGYDVSGLGSYPYTPYDISAKEMEAGELLCDFPNALVYVMPGISAFVGADIVSGIYDLDLSHKDGRKKLLLDLGTNGEMAFWNEEGLFVTSTAVGPAFEGGGISCGMPSVPGTISSVIIDGLEPLRTSIKTIGKEAPKGLCGSGILELVSELVRTGAVDGTGLLSDTYFENGFAVVPSDNGIFLTQKDIRNIQLAKAAVYTGVGALTNNNKPDVIYLSGGFGSNLDMDRIKYLGLIPHEWNSKVKAAGNTSLMGTVKFMGQWLLGSDEYKKACHELKKIADTAREVILTNTSDFDEKYIEAMNFREV